MSQAPRMSISDALFAIAEKVDIKRGSRYDIRRILQRLADSAYTDGYVDCARDRADEDVAEKDRTSDGAA